MEFPNDLLYTKDHEWARVMGDEAVIGITDHAQDSLGDVVYVELPKTGRTLAPHETFGVVESIKAVSDLYSPVEGTVLEANTAAASDPGIINRSPHADGWLIRVKLTDKTALSSLMNAGDYRKYVESLH